MKRFVLLIAIVLFACSVSAQGKWSKIETEEDELLGKEAGMAYVFEDPSCGAFVFWDWGKYHFRLVSTGDIFNCHYLNGIRGLFFMVGLYDEKDELIDKFRMWLDLESNSAGRNVRTRDAGAMFNPSGQKSKVQRIFNWINGGFGYVRIVGERYNSTNFDLRITPYPYEDWITEESKEE